MNFGVSTLISKREMRKQEQQNTSQTHTSPVNIVWIFLFPIYGGWACSPYAFSAEAQCAKHMQRYKNAVGPFPIRLDSVSTK